MRQHQTELQKQMKDNKRRATYGSGMALKTVSNLLVFVTSIFEKAKEDEVLILSLGGMLWSLSRL